MGEGDRGGGGESGGGDSGGGGDRGGGNSGGDGVTGGGDRGEGDGLRTMKGVVGDTGVGLGGTGTETDVVGGTGDWGAGEGPGGPGGRGGEGRGEGDEGGDCKSRGGEVRGGRGWPARGGCGALVGGGRRPGAGPCGWPPYEIETALGICGESFAVSIEVGGRWTALSVLFGCVQSYCVQQGRVTTASQQGMVPLRTHVPGPAPTTQAPNDLATALGCSSKAVCPAPSTNTVYIITHPPVIPTSIDSAAPARIA